MKITKRSIEAIPPQARDLIIFDEEVKGFGVRIWPTGKITYLVQYRSGGRTRRVKIGRHGVVTADQARSRAKEILGAVARGNNPAQEIREHRRAATVATVCERL
ncbi:MAG TPA: Arm DNA-binding domain-containing protein, partial [Stellaceae bacterium]|nr:Arm DNA-binding domain-containing protein [Stellaceae bacterium]